MIFLLRLAAIAIVFWAAYRLLKALLVGVVRRISFNAGKSVPQVADMVHDPVCGSYVSVDHAVYEDIPGGRLYFCSTQCRDKYKGTR